MTDEFLLIALVCTLASFGGAFVQRVSGFGYGIFVIKIYSAFKHLFPAI